MNSQSLNMSSKTNNQISTNKEHVFNGEAMKVLIEEGF